jgi:deazaflavin-dependent oxidoreductase (nitroreductase family)
MHHQGVDNADTKRREERITRWLPSRTNRAIALGLRLPSYLHRLRLGGLLGHQFLLLTHRSRKSGFSRRTPLEVLHYDPRSRESMVLSAWGKKADWFRNIEASAPLEVETAGERGYVELLRTPLQRFAIELGRCASHQLSAFSQKQKAES